MKIATVKRTVLASALLHATLGCAAAGGAGDVGRNWRVGSSAAPWPSGGTGLLSQGVVNVVIGDDGFLRVRSIVGERVDELIAVHVDSARTSFVSDPLEYDGIVYVVASGKEQGLLFALDLTNRTARVIWKGACGDWPRLEPAAGSGELVLLSDIGVDVIRTSSGSTVASLRQPNSGGCVAATTAVLIVNRDIVLSRLDGSGTSKTTTFAAPPRSLICAEAGYSILTEDDGEYRLRDFSLESGGSRNRESRLPRGSRWGLARVARSVVAWSPAEPRLLVLQGNRWNATEAPDGIRPRYCADQFDRARPETVCVTEHGYFTLRVP